MTEEKHEVEIEMLLTEREVARALRITRGTLQNQRCSGRGLPFLRLGRTIRYRQADVDAYLKACESKQGDVA